MSKLLEQEIKNLSSKSTKQANQINSLIYLINKIIKRSKLITVKNSNSLNYKNIINDLKH